MQAVTSQPTTLTDVDIVQTFLKALERQNLDKAFSLTAPTMRWQNHPFPPTKNKRQFEQQVRFMWKRIERFEVKIREIKRYDGVVFTDRVDVIDSGGFHMELPVEGTFKVEQGLVTEWVDRFAYRPIAAALLKSIPAILSNRLGRK